LEKIVMISPDTEASKALLRCLELLFPECAIESLTRKMNCDADLFINDDVKGGNNGAGKQLAI
jgi:hypothetical protein